MPKDKPRGATQRRAIQESCLLRKFAATHSTDTAMDSYYTLLKVTRESKFPEDATKAYRKLALRAHPDKGGSKEAFDALHRAYEVLKEEEKRKAYDRFGFDFGDEESADDLLFEVSGAANKYLGIAAVRVALCAAVVVGMRYRVPITLAIAACGACVVYGRTQKQKDFEFLGYRAVAFPLVAWFCTLCSLTPVFDVLVYAVTFGLLEWDGGKPKACALGLALFVRWYFGASLWFFVKCLLLFGGLLIAAHIFFVVVASVVKEVVDLKLKTYGEKFRKCMREQAPPAPAPESPNALPAAIARAAEIARAERRASPAAARKNSMSGGFLYNPKKKNR